MLRILGSPRRLCDGLTRRDLLHVGGLGTLGLALGDVLHAAESPAAATAASFGRAKSCILLYLYGSPSQLETFDVKPEAPVEIRGELGGIATKVPGLLVGELLPQVARIVDRTTVVRSMTHPYPVHGIAYATTGLPDPAGQLEVTPRDARHWPFLGSVFDYLQERGGGPPPELPANVALPFPLSTRRTNQPFRAGPYGGFLGAAYDPIWTEFRGEGNRPFVQSNRGVVQEFRDPYAGIEPTCRFELAAPGVLDAHLTLDGLDRRRSLLTQLEAARRQFDASGAADGLDRFRTLAWSMLASDRMTQALDVQREPPEVRQRYGMTLFGQSALAARRLIEAGSRLVSVFWDEYGLADSAWDTHYQHYARMKGQLCPSFDAGYAALIGDLEERGLLDETLVLCLSEHGRTPQLSNADGAGRDHWSRAYSAIFAGGGIAAGRVVGATDRFAGDVADTPISPKDIQASAYHLLGIDPHTTIRDALGRPYPIAGDGHVRDELLG
jgi:hypothetical protein